MRSPQTTATDRNGYAVSPQEGWPVVILRPGRGFNECGTVDEVSASGRTVRVFTEAAGSFWVRTSSVEFYND